MLQRTFHGLVSLILTLFLGGLIAATMVRYAPGFGVDERLLDPRLSTTSKEAIEHSYAMEKSLPAYYMGYMNALIHGDLGISHAFDKPVTELIRDRYRPTIRAICYSLTFAWLSGFGAAVITVFNRNKVLNVTATFLTAILLSMPAAVIAIALLLWKQPATLAVGFLLLPKVYRYTHNLLAKSASETHILMAHAKGLPPWRLFVWHMMPGVLPQLAALLGATLSVALTAVIPVEAVSDVPGLGQLAWQAALARDLPLLLGLTMLITLITVVVNNLAGLVRIQPVLVRPS
jgi:peptide/nickel transport system permease protein